MNERAYADYVRMCKEKGIKPTARELLETYEPIAENPAVERFRAADPQQKFTVTKEWIMKLVEALGNGKV